MNVPLILAVVVVSGVVAYLGDVIGKRLGKKRVTILGLRPRQTAVLIAVLTGCVITAGTMLTLAAASRPVREALFNYQNLRRQIAEAEADLQRAQELAARLTADVSRLEDEAADAQAGKARAESELAQAQGGLSAARADLAEAREGLEAARSGLDRAEQALAAAKRRAEEAQAQAVAAESETAATRAELEQASVQVEELRSRQQSLETSLVALEEEIGRIEEQRAAAQALLDESIREGAKSRFEATLQLFGYGGGVWTPRTVLAPGTELARMIIAERTDYEVLRRQVDLLIAQAENAAREAGCADYDFPGDGINATTGLLLILKQAEAKPGPDWRFFSLEERLEAYERFLNQASERAAELSQRGQVYITVNVDEYPVPRARPAIVQINMGLVRIALRKDYLLAHRSVPVGATKNEIAEALRSAIREARRDAVENQGVIWPEGKADEPGYEEVERVLTEVLRLHGMDLPANLYVIVTEDCRNVDVPKYRIDVDPGL